MRRILVPAVGIVAMLAVAGWLGHRFFTDPTILPPDDFVAFWGAGHVAVAGGNPYDDAQLLPVQTAAGWHRPFANMLWGPPWTLAAYMPFGALPARPAQLVWILAQLAICCGVGVWVWRWAGGPAKLTLLVPVAVLTFAPTMFLVTAGQNAGWVLLGLAGLVAGTTDRRTGWAMLGAVAALKPHLFGPVWLLLALDATRRKRTAAALGWGVGGGLLMIAAVTVYRPEVWAQYRAVLGKPASPTLPTLQSWQPPLIGYHLRTWLAPDVFAVQFVPLAVACLGYAGYWWRQPRFDWRAEWPVLVCVSLIAAPYSAWPFDLVLLIVPLMTLAARLATHGTRRQVWVAAGVYLGLNVLAGQTREAQALIWPAPAALAGWWLASRLGASGGCQPPEGLPG